MKYQGRKCNIEVENGTSKQKIQHQGRKCYTKVIVESNINVENATSIESVIKVGNDATLT